MLNAQGKDEEEAAALMGAKGFTIFRKITLPQMKWGLIYGIILCAARALGEFGAVNALSKTCLLYTSLYIVFMSTRCFLKKD